MRAAAAMSCVSTPSVPRSLNRRRAASRMRPLVRSAFPGMPQHGIFRLLCLINHETPGLKKFYTRAMAVIVKKGKVPKTPHTEFYAEKGVLALEEIHGVYGFSGAWSRKLH